MAKRPYVKFYVDDFFGSFKTQGMTTEQVGAYFLMLMAASQEPNIDLIDDDNYLGVITRLGNKFKKHSTVLKNCFQSENGKIYNDKLRKVLSDYDKFVENQRIKSAKGVLAKLPTGNPQDTQAEPVDNPTKTITNNHNQEPSKEVAKATKKESSVFVIPDENEVYECMLSRFEKRQLKANTEKLKDEAEQFVAHYNKVGWVVGQAKTKMKDWRAAITNWFNGKDLKLWCLTPQEIAIQSIPVEIYGGFMPKPTQPKQQKDLDAELNRIFDEK